MAADSFSFLDIVALPGVRERFARGDALVLLSLALDEIVWANGLGADLFGHTSIDTLLDAPAPLNDTARRQVTATRGFPQIDSDRTVAVRLHPGMGSRVIAFLASTVRLPDGANGILLSVPASKEIDATDAANLAIRGIALPDQAAAIIDSHGQVVAASQEFGSFELSLELRRRLFEKAVVDPDVPLKQRVQSGEHTLPVGVARLNDSLCLLIVTNDDFFDLPDDIMSASDAAGIEGDADEAFDLSAEAGQYREPSDDKQTGVAVLLGADADDDWYFSDSSEPETLQESLAQTRDASPIRFSWRTDPLGRFISVSPEFTAFVGLGQDALDGLHFTEVAQRFGLHGSDEVSDLLARRDTWSGRTVMWPLADGSLEVPVDLAALPTYSRTRIFDGFRGFGVVRTGDTALASRTVSELEDVTHQTLVAGDEDKGFGISGDGEQPSKPATDASAPNSEVELSSNERIAFLEIGARLKGVASDDVGTSDLLVRATTADDITEPGVLQAQKLGEMTSERSPDLQLVGEPPATGTSELDIPADVTAGTSKNDEVTGDGDAERREDDPSDGDPELAALGSEEGYASFGSDEAPAYQADLPPTVYDHSDEESVGSQADRSSLEDEAVANKSYPVVAEEPEVADLDQPSDIPIEYAAVVRSTEIEFDPAGERMAATPQGVDASLIEAVPLVLKAGDEAPLDTGWSEQNPQTSSAVDFEPAPLSEYSDSPIDEVSNGQPDDETGTSFGASESMSDDDDSASDELRTGQPTSAAAESSGEPQQASSYPTSDTTDTSEETRAEVAHTPLSVVETTSADIGKGFGTDDRANLSWLVQQTPAASYREVELAPDVTEESAQESDHALKETSIVTSAPETVGEDPSRVAGLESSDEALGPTHSSLLDASYEQTQQGSTVSTFTPGGSTLVADAAQDAETSSMLLPPGRPEADTAILDRLPISLLIHSDDRSHYANPEFLKLSGYASLAAFTEAGGLGGLFTTPWSPSHEVGNRNLHLRTKDGEEVAVEALLRTAPWRGSEAFLLVLRRLEGAARAEGGDTADLEHRLTEMRAIIDTATDGVVLVAPDGNVRSISRPAEALFGLDVSEASGRSFTSLFAMESQGVVSAYLDGLAKRGVESVLNDGREVTGREAKGGFIPLFMTIGMLPEGNGFCAVLRDITQWKRAEDELLQSRALAERASSHKTEFLARVSHEIRTPLNAIIGFSELMLDEKFGPVGSDRYRDYLRDINRSGNHVLDLVNDLLDISKIEAGQQEMSYEAVALNDALGETVATMQPQANRERVIIRSSLASRLPDVVADPRSVRQIALNILSNAIRFTQAGGQVIVSTAYDAMGDVVMRVRDTGIGMSQAEIEQALKPFKQINSLKRTRGDGTGLGLPLTKAMVEANRARFTISSSPGEGTMVEVTFPATRVLAE